MPETLDPFADAPRSALLTEHRHLSQSLGLASKYPADIAPFAAVATNTPEALANLHDLLAPGEHTWLFHDAPPTIPGLTHDNTITCLQMLYPGDLPLPEAPSDATILPLNSSHAAEMVSLTNIAFPGFFRLRTHVMGHYFGIRDTAGQLIAMCGERLICSTPNPAPNAPNPIWREISGLCTHPAHRGHGYAAQLLRKLIHIQRTLDATSVLHVASNNANAIALYHRLGFIDLREVILHRVVRTD
ncbi:GNAT family N-acetyltransferase [Granulicella sp. 5B5]|uniref:GNAT family N-acetyltransferase n=1 Tax=Granulicella sp. 5B5 TaxID=1617967 RepID=UPI0015F3600D|nr:GNAT family N-acetyltransferase [Granulicella sp. 5B5]